MSKTIKVIDLLNKMANGEEVPKRIKYNYETFKWDNIEKKYYKDRKDEDYIYISFDTYALNDTVEIIEEEPEIDIQEIKQIRTIEVVKDDLNIRHPTNLELAHKINELVKAVNQINNK